MNEGRKTVMKSTVRKKCGRYLCILTVCICFMSAAFNVYADNGKVISARADADTADIYLYIKGVSAILAQKVQIGNTICDEGNVKVTNLAEMEKPMKTVMLVDNSLSIPKSNRENIKAILCELLEKHMSGEQFWIGTISDSVTWLNEEFSSDYDMLSASVENIEYNNQDTYFSDCLYGVVDALSKISDGSYVRIVIISDGADDRAIGYTNAEVISLLAKSNVPVYTIGTVGDNAALENMFAFSRASGAESYLLDNSVTNEDIVIDIEKDQKLICIQISPDEALLDGSEKGIQLTLTTEDGEQILSTAVVMPFGTGSTTVATDNVTENVGGDELTGSEQEELPSFGNAAEAESQETGKTQKMNIFLPIGIIVACICIGIVIVVVIMKKRKKFRAAVKAMPEKETMTMSSLTNLDNERKSYSTVIEDAGDSSETLMINSDGGETRALWNTRASDATEMKQQTYLVVKDMERANVMFKVPIIDTVCIGRKNADIVIDYDKYVSSKQCEIRKRGEILSVKDLGSANGTYYENRCIYDQETTIASGSVIKVGKTKLRIALVKE